MRILSSVFLVFPIALVSAFAADETIHLPLARIPGNGVTTVDGTDCTLGASCSTPVNSAPSSTAVTYYVASTGNDSNPCSSGSKCLTINHALSLCPAVAPRPCTVSVSGTLSTAESFNFSGYVNSMQGLITIVGDTTTPANVTITGTATVAVPDLSATYVVAVFIPPGVNVKLSGLKFSGSGTSRGVFNYGGNLQLDNVTISCNSTFAALQTSLHGNTTMTGTNLIDTFQSGALGIYGNQTAYFAQYGGSMTINGPTGNNTSVGIRLRDLSTYDIHQGTSATLTITGVQDGIYLTNLSNFNSIVSTAAITITNTATPTASNGIYAGSLSSYNANPTTLTMNHFTTCLIADGNGLIVEKTTTLTSCGTQTSATQQAQIIKDF